MQTKKEKRTRRHARVRAKVSGTLERPRLAVFKSNRYLYVQVIDDTKKATLLSGDSRDMKGTIREKARKLGADVAKNAAAKGITAVVFDRGGFSYAGSIKEIAEGAREGGLKF